MCIDSLQYEARFRSAFDSDKKCIVDIATAKSTNGSYSSWVGKFLGDAN